VPGAVIYTTAGGALANLLRNMPEGQDGIDKTALIKMALNDPNVKICLIGISCALAILACIRYFTKGNSPAPEKSD